MSCLRFVIPAKAGIYCSLKARALFRETEIFSRTFELMARSSYAIGKSLPLLAISPKSTPARTTEILYAGRSVGRVWEKIPDVSLHNALAFTKERNEDI